MADIEKSKPILKPHEKLGVPVSKDEVIAHFQAQQKKYRNRDIFCDDFIQDCFEVSAGLVTGVDHSTIPSSLAQYLGSAEVQQSFTAGLEGQAYPKGVDFIKDKRVHTKIYKGDSLLQQWVGRYRFLNDNDRTFILNIASTNHGAKEVITGAGYHLSSYKFPVPETVFALSMSLALKEYAADMMWDSVKSFFGIDYQVPNLQYFYKRTFPPEIFYLLGLAQDINSSIDNFCQSNWHLEFQDALAILKAITFARTRMAAIPGEDFGRFKSTREVLDYLNAGEVGSALIAMETVLSQYPNHFHERDIEAIYQSRRIKLADLIQYADSRRPVPLPQETRITAAPTPLEAFRSVFGSKQESPGTVFVFTRNAEQEPEDYYLLIYDPEGTRSMIDTRRKKLVGDNVVQYKQYRRVGLVSYNPRLKIYNRHGQLFSIFADEYLDPAKGKITIVGKISKLLDTKGLDPELHGILTEMEKYLKGKT